MKNVLSIISSSGGVVGRQRIVCAEVERLLSEMKNFGEARCDPNLNQKILRSRFNLPSIVNCTSDVLYWKDTPVGLVVGDGGAIGNWMSKSFVMMCPDLAVVGAVEEGAGISWRLGPSLVKLYQDGSVFATITRHSVARSKWEDWQYTSHSWAVTDDSGKNIWVMKTSDRWVLGANSLRAVHTETCVELPFRLSSKQYDASKLGQSYGDYKNVLSDEVLSSGLPDSEVRTLFLANIAFRFMILSFDYDSGS